MGQTVAQKIVARAAGRDAVEAGDYVTVSPDYTCCQELAWQTRKRMMQEIGVDRVARPDKVIMVVDHTTSAAMGSSYHVNHREMKDFAFRNGVDNFFGAGSGLRHLVLTEKGFARPGLLVFSDEPNIASIGVVGALNIAVSSEVVATQIADENWMMVPKSARIALHGRLPFGALLRDLAQILIRDYARTDTLSQSCIEFVGPAIAGLSLDERQSLLACAYHTGADTALMPVDGPALAYVQERAQGRPFHLLESDADAVYVHEATYDLAAVSPMVTVPPELHGAVPVADVTGLAIHQAAIGSCAANRLDDLRAAAAILRGRKVDRAVTMYITPGSREVFAQAATEGLLAVFMDAGATVLAPGCTTCWGYEGVLSDGEVQISTHQMNYHGRNGSRGSRSYLASPYVVAASAVTGQIADPRPLLAERAEVPLMTAPIRGRVWVFGDNISADDGIIQYSQVPSLDTFDIPALKAMCFAELQPRFRAEVRPGDIVVAGRNFGHHSHQHACVAMKESGVAACVVESCDSAFIRKALNIGLPIVVCPGIAALVEQGELLEADLGTGDIRNVATAATLHARPFSARMLDIWRAGGFAPAMRRQLRSVKE